MGAKIAPWVAITPIEGNVIPGTFFGKIALPPHTFAHFFGYKGWRVPAVSIIRDLRIMSLGI